MVEMYTCNLQVDHVICDLPYFKVVKASFDNQWDSVDDYIEWFNSILKCINKIIKPNGNIILFCSRQNIWRMCKVLYENGFEENRTIIWVRKRGFNNTRGKALASGYEPILFWSKGKSSVFNSIKVKSNLDRPEYKTGILKDGITLSDVWTDIPSLPYNSKEKVNHPTQKPIKLMERIITLFTNKDDTVLDFCMGSGTTGVACKNLNRNFIGIEKDLNYFNIACNRLSEAVELKNESNSAVV
jgi:site-specific DNA-methyltransferase (adenine-specific)